MLYTSGWKKDKSVLDLSQVSVTEMMSYLLCKSRRYSSNLINHEISCNVNSLLKCGFLCFLERSLKIDKGIYFQLNLIISLNLVKYNYVYSMKIYYTTIV